LALSREEISDRLHRRSQSLDHALLMDFLHRPLLIEGEAGIVTHHRKDRRDDVVAVGPGSG